MDAPQKPCGRAGPTIDARRSRASATQLHAEAPQGRPSPRFNGSAAIRPHLRKRRPRRRAFHPDPVETHFCEESVPTDELHLSRGASKTGYAWRTGGAEILEPAHDLRSPGLCLARQTQQGWSKCCLCVPAALSREDPYLTASAVGPAGRGRCPSRHGPSREVKERAAPDDSP
jgi:hypothetical protein